MKDIEILKFSEDKTSSIFTISKPVSFVTGRDNLAQRVIKILFTSIGSDQYSPHIGTVFYDLMRVHETSELETIESTLPVILKKVEEIVKGEQTLDLINGKILKDDEILETLILKSYVWDEIFGGWIITIEVNTRAGSITYIQIP